MVRTNQVTNLSTKMNALKIRKKQICQHHSYEFRKISSKNLKQYLERYINTLPVFGFSSGRYGLNLKVLPNPLESPT